MKIAGAIEYDCKEIGSRLVYHEVVGLLSYLLREQRDGRGDIKNMYLWGKNDLEEKR